MTALSPDHLQLLALARAALAARDDKTLWKRDADAAIQTHSAACDAVWDELERQVQIADGAVPVLEHPSATKVRRAAQMRAEIIAAVQNAVEEALEHVARRTNDLEDDE